MSLNHNNGTPVVGFLELANGSLGPTAIPLFIEGAAYTLQAQERVYITNITLSSNDGTQAKITVDNGSATPTILAAQWLSATQPPGIVSIPCGCMRTQPGKVPRATATAITAAKFVEVSITGYVSRS